jgi:hypothetical protein
MIERIELTDAPVVGLADGEVVVDEGHVELVLGLVPGCTVLETGICSASKEREENHQGEEDGHREARHGGLSVAVD